MSVEISELAIPGSLFLCRCDQMPGENRKREGRFVSAHGFEVLHHCFSSWFQGSFAPSVQKRLGSGNGVCLGLFTSYKTGSSTEARSRHKLLSKLGFLLLQ